MKINLTAEDVQEVWHKMQILRDSPDLQSDYGITQPGADNVVASIPKSGGVWAPPAWATKAIKEEMLDHVCVLRDCANDARDAGNLNQAAAIRKQASRLAKAFR
jgi:hypothetical protein